MSETALAARSVEPQVPLQGLEVLRARYLRREGQAPPTETPAELFWRVASHVAEAERRYGGDAAAAAEAFYLAMARLEFLPNSPALRNAGTRLGQLASCFVLPVDDTLDGVFRALHDAAVIQQNGGGVGFDLSGLRPHRDPSGPADGGASGPVPFIEAFNAAARVVRQGSQRRANMSVLDVHHPDIEPFISAKRRRRLTTFALSVAVDDVFMRAAVRRQPVPLVDPHTGQPAGSRPADELLERIAASALATGDPGLIFVDRVNRDNPLPAYGRITATNPCGVAPLRPYESCVLGSINVAALTAGGTFDWPKLDGLVELGVRFLDDCLDATNPPLGQIAAAAQRSRKIGLGVMGFADALEALEVAYDDEKAVRFAHDLMSRMAERAGAASRRLAQQRGAYPAFARSRDAAAGAPPVRNATRLAIAPTSTLSRIAGCSSGIEPRSGPRGEHDGRDISVERQLCLQAAFQTHVDNAVAKTIVLPAGARVHHVVAAYRRAFELGCKGIAVRPPGGTSSPCRPHGGAVHAGEEV